MSRLSLVAANGRDVAWGRLLLLPAAVSFLLLVLPQAAFVSMSLHQDLGLGQLSQTYSLANYRAILVDPFYIHTIWLTLYLSALATALDLLVGFPTAYALARLGGWPARTALSLILTTSLITIVIKLLGLNLLLGASGIVNRALLATGIVKSPLSFINNQLGVLIGLVHYTLPILILMLFAVVQTIPRVLEEAAVIHGASRGYVMTRVVLPLAKAGMVGGGLIAFNMNMGAFTSAILLGGGRVQTLPVLIQEKIIQSNAYGMGSALSTVLLILVFIINVAVAHRVMRGGRRGDVQ
jgi:ABC-type spermidine/putrescine transport system permease subunit I